VENAFSLPRALVQKDRSACQLKYDVIKKVALVEIYGFDFGATAQKSHANLFIQFDELFYHSA